MFLNLQTNKYDFRGRVLTPTSKMKENGVFHKSFLCESKMGFMNDTAQRHGEYHDMTPRNFLQVIINNPIKDVSRDKQVKNGEATVKNSTENVYRYLGYLSTLDTIFDKLVDRLGGELRLRGESKRFISGLLREDWFCQVYRNSVIQKSKKHRIKG